MSLLFQSENYVIMYAYICRFYSVSLLFSVALIPCRSYSVSLLFSMMNFTNCSFAVIPCRSYSVSLLISVALNPCRAYSVSLLFRMQYVFALNQCRSYSMSRLIRRPSRNKTLRQYLIVCSFIKRFSNKLGLQTFCLL